MQVAMDLLSMGCPAFIRHLMHNDPDLVEAPLDWIIIPLSPYVLIHRPRRGAPQLDRLHDLHHRE
jgi:hypothetical protein